MNQVCPVNRQVSDRHPCSIESVPASANSTKDSVFICGCYELEESSVTREGEIGIYSMNNEVVQLVGTVQCPAGVLDMKFCDTELAVALSTGELYWYRFSSTLEPQLNLVANISKKDEGLFLSVDWSSNSLTSDTTIAVTTQQSSLVVYKVTNSELIQESISNSLHMMHDEPMPAWIVACDKITRNRLLTGGDDCMCRLWDTRANSSNVVADSNSSLSLIAKIKYHSAGVTSAMWHPHREHIFATGSYDEHVVIWDTRSLAKPVLDIHTGGGVWRTKWYCQENYDDLIITSSMQNGSRLYQLSNLHSSEGEINQLITNKQEYAATVKSTEKHFGNNSVDVPESHLSYGIDIIKVEPQNEYNNLSAGLARKVYLASCSFYENHIDTWSTVVSQ